jgi:prefoldin subunit 5
MKEDQFIEQEISVLEQQLSVVETLKAKVKETTEELAQSYIGIINAKEEFQKIKKQNLEELRTYKLAVSTECREIKIQIETINKLAREVSSSEIKTFVESCERLARLDAEGFFSRIRIGD